MDVERIRAALPRVLLDHVDAFDDEARSAVLDAVSSKALDAIRRTLAIGWLDMPLHMEFCTVLRDVVGREHYQELWAEAAKSFCQRPMLRGLVGMGQRLFVQTPRAAIRHLPTMYAMGTDGLGIFEIEAREEDLFLARVFAFPSERYDFANYVDGLHGALCGASEAIFPAWETTVEIVDEELRTNEVSFRYALMRRPEAQPTK